MREIDVMRDFGSVSGRLELEGLVGLATHACKCARSHRIMGACPLAIQAAGCS